MGTLMHLVPRTLPEKLLWERSYNKELTKALKEAQIENGKLKAYIDELKHEIKQLKINFEHTDYKRDLNLKKELLAKQETIKNLRKSYNNLSNENVKLKLQLQQNDN